MVLRKWEYQAQGCAWSVTTENLETYVELLKLHMQANHAQVAANSSSKTEKAKRLELGSDISSPVQVEGVQEGNQPEGGGHHFPADGVLY